MGGVFQLFWGRGLLGIGLPPAFWCLVDLGTVMVLVGVHLADVIQ